MTWIGVSVIALPFLCSFASALELLKTEEKFCNNYQFVGEPGDFWDAEECAVASLDIFDCHWLDGSRQVMWVPQYGGDQQCYCCDWGTTYDDDPYWLRAMTFVKYCPAVYLSGFYYSGYDGLWVVNNDWPWQMDGAYVYVRETPYGKRYLHRTRFSSGQSGWGIGPYGDRNWYYLWKLGEELFEIGTGLGGYCDWGSLCDDWHYWSDGWTQTPSHFESMECRTIDSAANAAAPNPNTEPMIEELAAHEGEASGFSDGHGSKSFDDFIPMILGAATGIAVVSGVVAFVVAMKRKTARKEVDIGACDAVHVPDASAMTTAAPNEETIIEDPVENATN